MRRWPLASQKERLQEKQAQLNIGHLAFRTRRKLISVAQTTHSVVLSYGGPSKLKYQLLTLPPAHQAFRIKQTSYVQAIGV
jgi:hypothetical protein